MASEDKRSELAPLAILLAEDDPINRTLTVTLLERYGHRVFAVENGREAVHQLETRAFDVVLMDVQMPMMDGLDATRAIRARERPLSLHTPIVALTANALEGDRQTCLDAGMDDYLAKPIRREMLIQTIERWGRTP